MQIYAGAIILFGFLLFYALSVQEYNNLDYSHKSKMIGAIIVPALCFVFGGVLLGMGSKEEDMKRDFMMACDEKRPGIFVCDFNTATRP